VNICHEIFTLSETGLPSSALTQPSQHLVQFLESL